MIEITSAQQDMKEKLIGTFSEAFKRDFEHYLRQLSYGINPEEKVIAEAFGINREELAVKAIKLVLDNREKSLKKAPDPNQRLLFEF